MDTRDLGLILVAGFMGILLGYAFWGQDYSGLNLKYQELTQDYTKLNQSYNKLQQSYNKLQQDYTQLEQEVGQVLVKYQACIGRENFFEWVSRVSSLFSLAKLFGIV